MPLGLNFNNNLPLYGLEEGKGEVKYAGRQMHCSRTCQLLNACIWAALGADWRWVFLCSQFCSDLPELLQS